MIFKKKDKESKPKKEKKVPVMKVGTHKKTVIALWLVLITSVSFGVYKNFTAIDMHTVHEKEVIEQRIVDTNRIENFVKAFEAAGGEIVADETFVEGTADFSAYLNNAVSGGADVIFAPSAIAYAPQIIEQASALGVSLPILGGDTWENSAISDAQNGTDMQVFVSTFFDENDESGLAKEFVSGYKAWLNGNSQNLTNNGGNDVVAAVSALGYDAYMAAVAAIEKAQSTDGTAIRDALAGLSIDAVTGALSFDANGDAVKSTAYIKQAINGSFQFYKVQSAD